MKALFLKSATNPLMIKYVELQPDNTFVVHDETMFELSVDQKASTELFDQIDQMLKRNKLEYAEINQIYVASGPGSYTGARLLVTIVKTIVSLYPSITVFDASLLDIFLQASQRSNNKDKKMSNYGIVPARRNRYYVASEVLGMRRSNQLASTMEVKQLVEGDIPCLVNGVKIRDLLNLEQLNHTLQIADWLSVSHKVTDVTLYEPYYLEEVRIG